MNITKSFVGRVALAGGLIAGLFLLYRLLGPSFAGSRPPIIIKGGSLTIELHRDWGAAKIEDDGMSSGRYLYKLDASDSGDNTSMTVTVIAITADGDPSRTTVRKVKKVDLVLAGASVTAESFLVTVEANKLVFDCKKKLLVASDDPPRKRTHEGYAGAYFRIKKGTLTLTDNTTNTKAIPDDDDVTYLIKLVTIHDD